MKAALLLLLGTLFFACKQEELTDAPQKSQSPTQQQKGEQLESAEDLSTIGVEKGQRKSCPPGSTRRCCDRKFCVVTPLSDYDATVNIQAVDYFQAELRKLNETQLKLTIPLNKITSASYAGWFLNDLFDAEYFPLAEAVTNPIGLSNIAIAPGQYPVVLVNGLRYEIVINYQPQIIEEE